MKSFFTAQFFAGNRRRLQALGDQQTPIVITGNGLLQRNGDTNYLFRQDSNFWYLTGVDIPEAVLVMDGDKEYLIVPDLSPTDEVFGTPYDYGAVKERSGIKTVLNAAAGWKELESRLKQAGAVATISAAPVYLGHYGFYTNPARRRLIKRLKNLVPAIEAIDIRKTLAQMRVVKQPAELAAIQKAIDITMDTLSGIAHGLMDYRHEYEIEADLTRGFRRRGALGHAFNPIVAGGKNSCHLHYQDNRDSLTGVRHLYLDVGAEVEHYAADITRTYFMGKPTRQERAVVDAVKAVQAFAIDQLKPGISIRENEKAVEGVMGEKLRELGLIKKADKESIRTYYTHSCSHYLGLDVHDVGDYDAPLQPGMVLTVEPGIYIKEDNLGVRIEDDVLITEKGCKVLSAGLQ